MKIIDLLNKIANGEEVPKKINYIDYVLTYDEETQDYYNEPNCTYSLLNDIHFKLNDEVVIIEEKEDKEKKIPEKLDISGGISVVNCAYKINEIIDYYISKGE